MIQVISAGGRSGGSYAISAPIMGVDFTWSGGDNTCMVLDDGDGNWRIKFLSSGTFTPLKNMLIDVFLVGGGGGASTTSGNGGGGGGGGYTKTVKSVVALANTAYAIAVGANGIESSDQAGTSSAFGASAAGGFGGLHSTNPRHGGSGGSAGHYMYTNTELAGGTDGGNGSTNAASLAAGIGQGTTTREFGEASGTLYANGGPMSTMTDNSHSFTAPQPNTGDGGGAWYSNGFPGASGIVIIRKHKEEAA